ncbi:MAG: type II CAAX endopeptidase family protein [Gemmatimonadota bacterium]|nr:type II CAAX endopeptidase family protein [Gemmatimonadota bacterium]
MLWWQKKINREGPGPRPLRETPSPGESALLLGAVMALFLLLMFVLLELPGLSPAREGNWRFAGVLLVELIAVGLPVAVFIRVGRFAPGSVLGLRPCALAALLGAVLMGVATAVVAPQFEAWQAGLMEPPEGYLEALTDFISIRERESLPWVLFCLALVPALCEEALFRGILLKACLARRGKLLTVIAVGLCFGLFHLDLWRAPILSIIGMLLTWTAIEAGSVWPAFVFHLVNNSVSLLLANSSWPAQREWIDSAGDVPPVLFTTGALLLVAGAALVEWGKKGKRVRRE